MACAARSGLKQGLQVGIPILILRAKWPVQPVRVSYENSGKRGKTGKGRTKLAQGEIAGSQKSVEADSLD
jgi:hypothetical protein